MSELTKEDIGRLETLQARWDATSEEKYSYVDCVQRRKEYEEAVIAAGRALIAAARELEELRLSQHERDVTVERRHREATALAPKTGTQFRASELEWIDCGGGSVAPGWERTAQALAAAEQAAAEAERAAVTAWLFQELGDDADQLAIDINLGKHVKEPP